MENIHSGNGNKQFRRRSISLRLTTSIILTVLIVSICSNYILYTQTRRKARSDLENSINRSISSIVDILEMPLWAYDEETIEDIGKLYADNELVARLVIRDSLDKTLFENIKVTNDETIVKSRIVYHGKKIAGSVEMALTSSSYKRMMRQILWSNIITAAVNLSVLILLTGFFLRLYLKKPMTSLSSLVDSYASGGYDNIDTSGHYAEFESVVNVVTDMGNKITYQMEELRVAEKKFRGIFENALEGIFQFSPEGSILSANPAVATLFGFESPEEMANSVTDIGYQCFSSPEALQQILDLMDPNGVLTAHEVEIKQKNGEYAWASLSLRTEKGEDGKVLYYEGSMIDISDKKEKEAAERRQKAADAANQAKTLFIAKMSHEIRTPLNSVLGMTELLKETDLSGSQQEYIDVLYSSGEFLQAIINDILDFSKLEARQFEMEQIPFSLSDVANEVFGLFAFKAKEKRIAFNTSLAPEISPFVIGDPLRLKQILINLIGNAIKFTSYGSVSIEIKKIADSPESKDRENILFSISDTGIGIPFSKQDKIFDSFTQADSFVSRQYGGTGLGLSICKKLVEHMGGEISVESHEGTGTEFSFTLGFRLADKESLAKASETDENALSPGMKILLVDDIPPNRTVIHKFLEAYSPVITDAENGREAMDKFTTESFDFVLMDVEMPVMNGLEATEAIRRWEDENGLKSTPLIVLSAHAFGEQRKKCFEAGCDDLLVKPIRKKDLINTIASLTLDKKDFHDIVKRSNLENASEVSISTQPETVIAPDTIQIDSDFEDLFPDFVNYFYETLEHMTVAASDKDFESLFRLGHGLKGSARNYELYDLGNIFLSIEKAAQDDKLETIMFNIEKAKTYLDSVNVEFVNKG